MDTSILHWRVLNNYRRLTDRKLLICPDCGEEYGVGLGTDDDEPVFWCFYCDKTVYFGTDHWSKIISSLPAA